MTISSAKETILEYEKREANLIATERALTKKEIELAKKENLIMCAEYRIQDMKELTSLVFNSKFTKTVTRSFPMVNKYVDTSVYNSQTGQYENHESETISQQNETIVETTEGN